MAAVNSVCTNCDLEEIDTTDFFEGFVHDDKSMDYYDGPLAGWTACTRCGRWYAFDCAIIIESMLWHWTLVRSERATDPRATIENAAKDRDGWWLSVIEDRRRGDQRCRGIRIQNKAAKPVVVSPAKGRR